MNGIKSTVIFVLLITSITMFTSCGNNDSDNYPIDDSNDSNGSGLIEEIGSTTGIFGFEGGGDHHYFIQKADSKLGNNEESNGDWVHDWYLSNNSFTLDGEQYIFGFRNHFADYMFFIQKVLPSGKLGKETDSGHDRFQFQYSEAIALTVNDGDDKKVFIFMIEGIEDRWAIWEVKDGGKLANERSDHGYADRDAGKVAGHGTLTALTLDTKACFYGQHDGTKPYDFDRPHSWAIQCITKDGKLENKSRDHGEWDNFWGPTTSYRTTEKTYIFGHRKKEHFFGHSSSAWFIQRIYDDGTMGRETEVGEWNYYYPSLTSYKPKRSYIMGQSHDYDKHWFIQHVTGEGKMGAVTDGGHWNNFYPYLIPIELD